MWRRHVGERGGGTTAPLVRSSSAHMTPLRTIAFLAIVASGAPLAGCGGDDGATCALPSCFTALAEKCSARGACTSSGTLAEIISATPTA
jgi:hypothetical protein